MKLISEILKERNISFRLFCQEVGMSESGLKRIIRCNSTRIQSLERIAEVLGVPVGLFFGEGSHRSEPSSSRHRSKDRLPHIPFQAQAGALAGYSSGVGSEDCDFMESISQFGSYDFTIDVKGDSMKPEYESGDVVACRLLRHVDELKYGKVYVIDSSQGVVLKRIESVDGDQTQILCVSTNIVYEPYKLSKEELFSLSRVVGVIKSEKE
ncbi:MAG: S24 family peptidase [Bacteroidales bacterium]